MADPTSTTRVERNAKLRWVPIAKMKVNPLAQREVNQARIDHLAVEFDPEQVGTPTVNERDGSFYIIDGQHRIEAMRQMGWNDQQIQCWTYVGLSEEDEAERFLKLNDTLVVLPFAKYRAAITAGRSRETEIDRVVRAQGLVVSADKIPGAIRAVGTVGRLFDRAGSVVLGRTLRIIRDAYGDSGLEAPVIDGLGLLCQRYNGELDDVVAVTKLASANGGVNGLLNRAQELRLSTGNAKGQCVAAAAVEFINRGRGGHKKLRSWWKDAE